MNIADRIPDPSGIRSLSRMQISTFFKNHSHISEDVCQKIAAKLIGQPVAPTTAQGQTSYTVRSQTVESQQTQSRVVQFRDIQSPLDLDLIVKAQQTYGRVVPGCQEVEGHLLAMANQGNAIEGIKVYVMDYVPGEPYSLAQKALFGPEVSDALKKTVKDFATYIASAWIKKPPPSEELDIRELERMHRERLAQLSASLPPRFQEELSRLRDQLPRLFEPGYPQVLNHVDLMEMNIHVDAEAGGICGVVDWADATYGPFGLSLWGLETLLGVLTENELLFHPQNLELRALFWKTFYSIADMTPDQKEQVEIARKLGLFEAYGFNGGVPVKDDEDGKHTLNMLSGTLAVDFTATTPL